MTIALRHAVLALALLTVGCERDPNVTHIDSDVRVDLLPTAAHLTDEGWVLPVRAWVYEPEADSIWRSALIDAISDELDLDEPGRDCPRFDERVQLFLTDSEPEQRIVVAVGAQREPIGESAESGHVTAQLIVDVQTAAAAARDGYLPVRVALPESDDRRFVGRAMLVPPTGLSVISDIDDTVRISHIGETRAMLEAALCRDFEAVPGMADFYQTLADRGAVFHYVSGSPWQLAGPLVEFFDRAGLPAGSMHLRLFRWQEQSLDELLGQPLEQKLAAITRLFDRYPQRRFILVGDSSEQDPEVYAQIAERFPEQVEHVYIRNVTQQPRESQRYQQLFADLPAEAWTIFSDATELTLGE